MFCLGILNCLTGRRNIFCSFVWRSLGTLGSEISKDIPRDLLGIVFEKRRIICLLICGNIGCGPFLLPFFLLVHYGFRKLFRIVLELELIYALFYVIFWVLSFLFIIRSTNSHYLIMFQIHFWGQLCLHIIKFFTYL